MIGHRLTISILLALPLAACGTTEETGDTETGIGPAVGDTTPVGMEDTLGPIEQDPFGTPDTTFGTPDTLGPGMDPDPGFDPDPGMDPDPNEPPGA